MTLLRRFSDWLTRVSTGWVALGAFIGLGLFVIFVLPRQEPATESPVSAVGIPDLLLFYSPQTLSEMAEAYGAQGRMDYVRGHLTFDVVWPLVYTISLVTGISWTFGQFTAPQSRWRLGNLVPLFGVLWDFTENLTTSWVMYRYPDPARLAAAIAPFATLGKWLLALTSLLLLTGGVLGVLWRIVRRK